MQAEGYWLNGQTGVHYEIDEHARWITTAGNAQQIGLAEDLRNRLDRLCWSRDRLRILLTAMQGGLIRIRDHREFIAIEYTVTDVPALLAIGRFLKTTELAGPFSLLHIHNLRQRRGLRVNYETLSGRFSAGADAWRDLSADLRDREDIAAILDELDAIAPLEEE